MQYLANVFWRRWTQEYVTVMQERQKWSKARTNLKVGDIVVVVDPTSPRSSWPLARIVETKPDSNGICDEWGGAESHGNRARPVELMMMSDTCATHRSQVPTEELRKDKRRSDDSARRERTRPGLYFVCGSLP